MKAKTIKDLQEEIRSMNDKILGVQNAETIILEKSRLEEKMIILQILSDSQDNFSEAQVEFAKAQSKIIEALGSLTAVGITGDYSTLKDCVINTDQGIGVLIKKKQ